MSTITVDANKIRPLSSLEEILAARRNPLPDEKVTHFDCLCLARLEGSNNKLWVSSPNMEFIPEIPIHSIDKPFTYFSDGMLGPFEYIKWPQAFTLREPHHMAAPADPKLMQCGINGDPRWSIAFPVVDVENVLPQFADPLIPWHNPKPFEFVACEESSSELAGNYCDNLLNRLRAAIEEIREMGESIGIKMTTSMELSESAKVRQGHSYLFQHERCQSLYRSYRSLTQVPLSYFDALLWFREFQRILLELRGWVIYTEIVKPCLDNPQFHCKGMVLPLRGIITRNVTLVEQLLRVGVPVWYIRPRYTLTNHTLIMKVRTIVRCVHSSDTVFKSGDYAANAPEWKDAIHHEDLRGNLIDQLKRYQSIISISNAPILPVLELYSPEEVGRHIQAKSEEHDQAPQVPDLLQAQAEYMGCDDDPLLDEGRGNSDLDTGRVQLTQELYSDTSGFDEGQAPDVLPPQNSYFGSTNQVDESCTTIDSSGEMALRNQVFRLKMSSGQASQRTSAPHWVPEIAPGWARTLEDLKGLSDDPNLALSYPFPPAHLFFSDGSDFISQRIHNWLRIRMWCFTQIIAPPSHGMVLMTTSQWRNTLTGCYHAIEYDNRVVHPRSSAADIARLPPAPRELKKRRLESNDGRKDGKKKGGLDANTLRRRTNTAHKRLADRIDINVRFAVYARFAPYNAEMIMTWGRQSVTRSLIDGDKDLWAEVVWEMSIVNFRVELLELDRLLLRLRRGEIGQRQTKICEIWGGGLRPMWHETMKCDPFGLGWELRCESIKKFANIMQVWPNGQRLVWQGSFATDESAYIRFEQRVFSYYICMHRVHRGRLPSIPLVQPLSLLSRL